MSGNLKKQTAVGIGWSAVERFSYQGVSFLVQIILARILTPADYGLIGMVAIFMQLAQVLVDSGFANALIKKQNCDENDYSTVFYFNLGISIGIYLLLFAIAPGVSRFYNQASLVSVMRIITLTIIINSLSIVPRTMMVKAIDFKSQTKVSLFSALLSGCLGIYLAHNGYGVWSLVCQQLANSIFQVVFFYITTKWVPSLIFSISSFNELFGFGSKLLLASIANTIYKNLYSIVIGKRFSSADLGYYTRAEQIAMFPSYNIGSIISRVTYPAFSKIQDDNSKLLIGYRKIIRLSSLVIFPMMIMLASLSDPLINLILTKKWIGMSILLKLLCVDWMLDHLSLLNLNLLYVKGRSDLVLKLEVVKKTIAVIILIACIPYGLTAICIGRVLYSIIATFINMHYTSRLVGLTTMRQLYDFLPFILASFVMGSIVYYLCGVVSNDLVQICLGTIVGILVYFLISILFFKKDLKELHTIIAETKKK